MKIIEIWDNIGKHRETLLSQEIMIEIGIKPIFVYYGKRDLHGNLDCVVYPFQIID